MREEIRTTGTFICHQKMWRVGSKNVKIKHLQLQCTTINMIFNMQSMALSKHDTVRLLVIYNLTTTPLREHPISPTCGRARHLCCNLTTTPLREHPISPTFERARHLCCNLTTTPLREHPISPTCGRTRHLCCLNPLKHPQFLDLFTKYRSV